MDPDRRAEVADADLRARVQALAHEEEGLIPSLLDRWYPWSTPNVTYIVAQGRKAIPLLVEALDGPSPTQVIYAAYCLQQMKASEGRSVAERRLAEYTARGGSLDFDEHSAAEAIRDYLVSLDAKE